MAGVVASIQAAEALKVLLGRLDLLRTQLGQLDLWNNGWRAIDLANIDRSGCRCCGQRRFDFLEAGADETVSLCGADAVQVLSPQEVPDGLDLEALAARLTPFGSFTARPSMLRGAFAEQGGASLGLTVFRDGRAIIKGTTDLARARSIYARYIGA
jgi:adenylyltransferase/sulfurtransferase